MEMVDLCKLFNNDNLLVKEIDFDKSISPDGHVPPIDDRYVFECGLLDEVLLFLAHPYHDCLYLSGPAGCGKTSLILQIAARLGWGVEQITLSNKSESLDLIGHQTLRRGELVYEYGPLTNAMIYGEILILNEIDLVAPGDLAALNDVLEGKPLTIVGNSGEIIYPHKSFRVVATANTRGNGDSEGFYSGARILNQAFLDRFRFMQVDYPQANVEMIMLRHSFPNLEEAFCKRLVRFAHELRRVLQNSQEAGISQLSAPFSTRVLLRIGAMMSLGVKRTIQRVVDTCYSLRLPKVEREYVQRLCNDIFGHKETALELLENNPDKKDEAENAETPPEEVKKPRSRTRKTAKS